MAYKALLAHVTGEGIHGYIHPPGEEELSHATVEQAASHLLDNYGPAASGIVTDLNLRLVLHV